MTQPILSLCGIARSYRSRKTSGWGWTTVHAAVDVNLEVREGETLAIVGESGSGKSTLAKLLLMLQPPSGGDVKFHGVSLARLDKRQREEYRRQVQAVFQDPASSLNPMMTVERTLGYIVRRYELASRANERTFIQKQLASVGLTPAEQYLDRFPHQLSGGQQQRIAIARAMMLEPKVIIADEPLSSLDMSIQAQVLRLMMDLRKRTNVGFVVISHDLGAMQSIADRTAVMYRGRIVEIGADVYTRPVHPYTRLLLDARLAPDPRAGRIRSLAAERPVPPRALKGAGGCRFRNRCPSAIERCAAEEPALRPVAGGATQVACHRAEELMGLVAASASKKPSPSREGTVPTLVNKGERQ
ncbi:oligopeptide/dipeptide ABC transporter ATP-binding protein [Mesorhizobium sp. 1B3]|uniref:oligopeptide/dipeptide ABC transporter ATP-binding protein n=1 Tax=Mesorhizobium sp. 1B3 TaxID=3243599 RepID=UPI003D96850E